MTTVNLHIGTMKSGTSYLQQILTTNKPALLSRGVLFPGARWRDQQAAAEDAANFSFKGKPTPGSWDALADEVRKFDGAASVISMEFLSFSDGDAARRVVESFPGHRVRVIVTARDLARVVPSQWQQSVKNGAVRDFDKYLAMISAPGARTLPGARAFWGPQDLGRILRTWQPLVDPDNLVLVTVPPRGADRDLLWQRFSTAAELPTFDIERPSGKNESLGEASVELLLQLNRYVRQRNLPRDSTRPLRRILAARADREASLTVPETYRGWVAKTAEKIAEEVTTIEPVIVGDLDELRVPEWRDQAATGHLHNLRSRLPIGTRAPAADEEIVDAALDALLGLTQRLARSSASRPGR